MDEPLLGGGSLQAPLVVASARSHARGRLARFLKLRVKVALIHAFRPKLLLILGAIAKVLGFLELVPGGFVVCLPEEAEAVGVGQHVVSMARVHTHAASRPAWAGNYRETTVRSTLLYPTIVQLPLAISQTLRKLTNGSNCHKQKSFFHGCHGYTLFIRTVGLVARGPDVEM